MKKTVLIIDDFENTLFVTGFTIQKAGYDVAKALSGKEALDYLKAGKPANLIITDYNMPGMNGIQFIQELKTANLHLFTPIFVLSTETDETIKKKALKMGVTAWIPKPFKTEKLIEYIKRAIG